MIILKILLYLLLILMLFHFTTKKYINPYKLIMVFGKKGSGKSTMQVKFALEHIKRGWKVYCTTSLPMTYYLPDTLIGQVELEQNSLLLVDEVGMLWDNRDYKNFKPEVRDWFKLQRHRKIKVILFSQSFDVDKKIRDLVDEMYLVVKIFRIFSYAKKIRRNIIITQATSESPSCLADQLEYENFLLFLFGSRKFTFIPKYIKYFDSFYANELRQYQCEYIPVPKEIKDRKLKIKIIRRMEIWYIKLSEFKKLITRTKKIEK